MKSFTLNTIGLLVLFIAYAKGQRVAPGVPPQQYQQVPHHQKHLPPPPQYQQQMPAQHHQQQAQVQYQQQQHVPVQAQQQQQHHQQHAYQQQQQPPAQHHPHAHGQPQQVLNAANIQHERQHIAEHLEVPIDTSKMTEQELQFHYFKMHDSDNNNKLDGCELIKSLIHWHEQGSKDENRRNGNQAVEEKIFSDEELVSLIDPILQMDDTSRDGYIDYPEFIKAQQKAAAQQQQQNSNRQQQGN